MQRVVAFFVLARHGRFLMARAKGIGAQVSRLYVRQIVPAQVRHSQLAEDVVQRGRRHLDDVVAFNHAVWLEAGEGEAVDEFFQRHAVLETQRHGDGEVVHHGPESRAFLVHVDKDLAQGTVFEFAGPQVDLVTAHDGLLGVTLPAVWQALTLWRTLNDTLDDALSHDFSLLLRVGLRQFFCRFHGFVHVRIRINEQCSAQRLGQLGAVAVEGVCLDAQFPGQHVGVLDLINRRRVRHVDGLGDCAGDERLGRRHHADVGLGGQLTRPLGTTAVGTVKDLHVRRLQVRRAFDGHGATDVLVGCFDLFSREAHTFEHVEAEIAQLRIGEAQHVFAEVITQAEAVESKLQLEGRAQRGLDGLDLLFIKALGRQRFAVDARCVGQRARTDSVSDDVVDLIFAVAKVGQSQRNRLVDDLEVTAAGQLLELHQREVRLDARGVTVHDQTDGAGWCNHGGLCVAEAVLFAFLQRPVPSRARCVDQGRHGAIVSNQRNRQDRQVFVTFRLAVRSPAVVADDAQHGSCVLLVTRESPALGSDLSRGRVGNTGHQRGQTATDRAAFVGVVAVAHGHEQRANVGEAQTKGAVLVRQLGDFLGRELRHENGGLQRQGPEATSVLVAFDVQRASLLARELHQVQGREVTSRVVEEHVLGTRVGRVDAAGLRTGVPLVDGAVVLQTRISTGPGRKGNLIPEVSRLYGLKRLARRPCSQIPGLAALNLAEELVGHADGVVGVLTRYRQVSVAVPVGVVGRDFDLGETLPRHFDHAVDVVVWHLNTACFTDSLLQLRVGLGIKTLVAVVVLTRGHDGLHVLVQVLGSGNKARNLLLFDPFPADVVLDVRVIGIDRHHFRCTTSRTAGLDGTRRTVTNAQERHEARRTPAAAEGLAFATQRGEV